MAWAPDDWKRLGKQLVARRVDLENAWSNRRRFTDDNGVDYRVVYDIEKARRDNFSPSMIRRLEKAYKLRAGAIAAVLDGEDMDDWMIGAHGRGSFSRHTQIHTRSVEDGEFEVFLAEAVDALAQLSPQQREEAERTTIRLLRGMLRDMGADI